MNTFKIREYNYLMSCIDYKIRIQLYVFFNQYNLLGNCTSYF